MSVIIYRTRCAALEMDLSSAAQYVCCQSNVICNLEWIDRPSRASKRSESEGQSRTAVYPSPH